MKSWVGIGPGNEAICTAHSVKACYWCYTCTWNIHSKVGEKDRAMEVIISQEDVHIDIAVIQIVP